jgi:hypothetical protein
VVTFRTVTREDARGIKTYNYGTYGCVMNFPSMQTTVARLVLLAFTAALLPIIAAQNPPAHTQTKQISHYMREAGLQYLENTKRMVALGLKNPNASLMIDPATEASGVNFYGEILQETEDHIRINVSSAADKQYLRILQRTKAAAELTVFGDLSNLYVDCYAQAHRTAINGSIAGGTCTEHRYEDTAKAVRDAQLKTSEEQLAKATKHLADVENGVPDLTPTQKELCAKDPTLTLCAGTPEANAKWEADKRAKTRELCAKGVFDKEYCDKFEASQKPDKQ